MVPTQKKHIDLRSCAGISMVEIIVTILIFSIIAGACYGILMSGSDSWKINELRAGLQQELRQATDWLRHDLMETGSGAITDVSADGSWHTAITFYAPSGVSGGKISWAASATKYSLAGTNLQRTIGTDEKLIAQHIKSFQVKRDPGSSDIVEVALVAEGATSRGTIANISTTFKVYTRN